MTEAIFWQYPVITEKVFWEQNKHNQNYIGIPWATIIDKNINTEALVRLFGDKVNKDNYNITCCQHIYFRKLIKVFKAIGIKVLYTPHKVYSENQIDGILLKACPLYAINIEDENKNKEFTGVDFLTVERNKLYTFQGAYQNGYLSDIRKRIFALEKKPDVEIRYSGDWHFNKIVYSDEHQNKSGKYTVQDKHVYNTVEYNKLLLDSQFSLCPSGTGPNSIRLWESLAVGTIPVILSDQLELPEHPLWPKAIIRMLERDLANVDYILRSMSAQEIKERRKNCMTLYKYFRSNYMNTEYDSSKNKRMIIHYCCGNYQTGDFGGVARFDHCLKSSFPDVIMYQGPHQKSEFLSFINQCEIPPVIFTDNHLVCDIPNEFKTIVVNHGCAERTNEYNKDWDEYWKKLCLDGQSSMLQNRKPDTTVMMPICKSVYDDFVKYHGEMYTKFKIRQITHYSYLNDKNVKKYTANNLKIRVLGKFNNNKIIDKLVISELNDKYYFQNINVDGRFYKTAAEYIDAKQKMYLQCDMFIHISSYESSVYEILDAITCGIVVVSTDVGLSVEMPDNSYVAIDAKKVGDVSYMQEKLKFAWQNKDAMIKVASEWIATNHSKLMWKDNVTTLIKETYGE